MQTDKLWNQSNLPYNAKPYGGAQHNDGGYRFAYIGETSHEPDGLFVRDDGGRWHCVEDCDFYALELWYGCGVALAITENEPTGTLSARFRDWRSGPTITVFSHMWLGNQPVEQRGPGDTRFYLGDENGREHRVSEADYRAVVQWRDRGIELVIVKDGDALTVRDRKTPTERCLVVPAIGEVAA